MSIAEIEERLVDAHVKTVNLQVRYIGARKPFVDPKTPATASLNQIKPSVLDFFGLVEGAANGGTKTYTFAQDGKVLPDQNATVGALAGDKHELKLDLLERFEQG